MTPTQAAAPPDFLPPRCPSCGKRGMVWGIRSLDGAPVGECACGDGVAGSPEDVALIVWVRGKVNAQSHRRKT